MAQLMEEMQQMVKDLEEREKKLEGMVRREEALMIKAHHHAIQQEALVKERDKLNKREQVLKEGEAKALNSQPLRQSQELSAQRKVQIDTLKEQLKDAVQKIQKLEQSQAISAALIELYVANHKRDTKTLLELKIKMEAQARELGHG